MFLFDESAQLFTTKETQKIAKLLRVFDKIDSDDIAPLEPLIKGASIGTVIGLFQCYEALLDLNEESGTPPLRATDRTVRQALFDELFKRGVRYVPASLETVLPDSWRELLSLVMGSGSTQEDPSK